MRVIDARSGSEMKLGDRVDYPHGEWMRLVDVNPGLFSATAVVETNVLHPADFHSAPSDRRFVRMTQEVPLTVRWFHPKFLFQHVAFIPS